MNASDVNDRCFQFITISDGINVIATETPLFANECASTYHISEAALCTPGEATTVISNHEVSLVSANDIVPVAAQLKLVHDGMEFYLGEYPIHLLPAGVAVETGNGAYPDGNPVSDGGTFEILSTVCNEVDETFTGIPTRGNNISLQPSTTEMFTATATHDGTAAQVMHPQNHQKSSSETNETVQHMSNIADCSVLFTKRQADINFVSPNTSQHNNTAMQKENCLTIHPQLKRKDSQANIKPLQLSFPCNKQATMFKVVSPGKIDGRLLYNYKKKRYGGTGGRAQKKIACAGMPQPVQHTPLKRMMIDKTAQKTRSSSKGRPRTDCVLNKTGVQTRSGRLSKPPQALTDGFVCRVTKDNHDHQQTSCDINTSPEVRFHLEEDKENPEQHMAKLEASTARRKAKVQPQHQCGTCHKIYLGRRMARHLHAFPTHVTLDKLENYKTKSDELDSTPAAPASPSLTPALQDPSLSPPTQLYRLLVDLVTAPETESNQRAVLLGEISQFVGLVRSRVPSLIVPSEREDNETVYVDQNVADVLQLNPGNYRIRMDAFVQEREKFLHTGGAGSDKPGPASPVSNVAEQEKHPDSAFVSSELDCEITAVSSFEALLQDFAELEQQEQQGLLMPLPLPKARNENTELKATVETAAPVLAPATAATAFSEPAVISNQGTTAFGRPCQLSEELFPSQSQEVLQAFEELTNLSELCSPQVLGVSSNAAANESLAFD